MTLVAHPKHNFRYENTSIDIFHVDKGYGLPKHEHKYSHATFCMSGSCVIRKDGKEVIVDKYTQPINLIANEWHEIEALEDGTVFCNVFSEAHNQIY
jgi:quercetin dioxygenase-like cupin family protein